MILVRRFVAAAIDCGIIGSPLVLYLVATATDDRGWSLFDDHVLTICALAYFVLFSYFRKGMTLGKLAAGLALKSSWGTPPSLYACTLKYSVMFVAPFAVKTVCEMALYADEPIATLADGTAGWITATWLSAWPLSVVLSRGKRTCFDDCALLSVDRITGPGKIDLPPARRYAHFVVTLCLAFSVAYAAERFFVGTIERSADQLTKTIDWETVRPPLVQELDEAFELALRHPGSYEVNRSISPRKCDAKDDVYTRETAVPWAGRSVQGSTYSLCIDVAIQMSLADILSADAVDGATFSFAVAAFQVLPADQMNDVLVRFHLSARRRAGIIEAFVKSELVGVFVTRGDGVSFYPIAIDNGRDIGVAMTLASLSHTGRRY